MIGHGSYQVTEFAYNNSKNVNTGHISFELNCGYHVYVSFKDKCDKCSKSSLAEAPAIELRELINLCCQNFLHV